MFKAPRADFWRVGVVPGSAPALIDPQALTAMRSKIAWMPDAGDWRYVADPFGLSRGGATHIFVEAYDYRTKHGVIEHRTLTPDGRWSDSQVVLERPVHLSYPFMIEDGGTTFMVPESHRAGEVALYVADDFPTGWRRETALLSDMPVAEPSLIKVEDRWWMFFTLVGPGQRDQKELHVAFADALTGPWTLHPGNPVRTDRASARPGGTPWVGMDGAVILPVQDCCVTYGGALRFLRFTTLNPREITIEVLPQLLTGGLVSDSHVDGCHTFAACGGVTLVDVKRQVRDHGKRWIDFQRRARKLIRRG